MPQNQLSHEVAGPKDCYLPGTIVRAFKSELYQISIHDYCEFVLNLGIMADHAAIPHLTKVIRS